jgi:hypothetical protein
LAAFLTETIPSMTLSVMPETNMPLKQLWWEVMCFTVTWLLTPVAPTMKMPWRLNFCTIPGPRIDTPGWLVGGVVPLLNVLGGAGRCGRRQEQRERR